MQRAMAGPSLPAVRREWLRELSSLNRVNHLVRVLPDRRVDVRRVGCGLHLRAHSDTHSLRAHCRCSRHRLSGQSNSTENCRRTRQCRHRSKHDQNFSNCRNNKNAIFHRLCDGYQFLGLAAEMWSAGGLECNKNEFVVGVYLMSVWRTRERGRRAGRGPVAAAGDGSGRRVL